MIVQTRALLLCHQVLRDDEFGVSLQGVFGENLTTSTKPGVRQAWLVAQIETDGKPTYGRLRVSCSGLDPVDFHFAVPAPHKIASLSAPLQVPIAEEGNLTVAVVDEFSRTKPHKQRWRLGFTEDAELLSAETAAPLLAAAAEATREVAELTRRQSQTGERPH